MLLVKRQMVNQGQQNQATGQVQHQQSQQQSQSPQQQVKTQILQQFTPSIQLQSGSGQQHIALVKTSTGGAQIMPQVKETSATRYLNVF